MKDPLPSQILPGPILVPPHKQRCTTYDQLRIHFMQSPDLSWIFTETYALESEMVHHLRYTFEGETDLYGEFIEERCPPSLYPHFLALQNDGHANGLGCAILVNMWDAFCSAANSMPEYDEFDTDEPVVEKFMGFIHALKPSNTTLDTKTVPFLQGFGSQRELFQDSASTGFGATYFDPHNAVPYYCAKFHEDMKAWQTEPEKFKGPFSSLLSSSMTGKSRLLKEIAMIVPTVYICARDPELELETSYPSRSYDSILDYLLGNDSPPPLQTPFSGRPRATLTVSTDTPEVKSTRRFKIFLCALLHIINNMGGHDENSNLKEGASPQQIREFLWYIFAEPDSQRFSEICELIAKPNVTPVDTYVTFYRMLMDEITRLQIESQKAGPGYYEDKLDKEIRLKWIHARYVLNWWKAEQHSEPMLLVVWDEARTFVNTGVDGQKFKSQSHFQMSKFRCLQRAIREVGHLQYPHGLEYPQQPVRIFHLFTDTTSQMADFVPVETLSGDRGFFPPLVNVPSYDYYANALLDVTIDPEVVSDFRRLLKFGRSGWYSMSGGDIPRVQTFEMVAIASRKLTRKTQRELERILVSRTTDESIAIMTAILACRLALYTGPYVQLTHELVAFHMMTVQKCPNTLELHAHYPSEPILAEASAQVTARHGWNTPLESLTFCIRHGLVDKGYRGELICKILLLMAMEDCLRHTPCDRTKNFKQSRPVPLKLFLSYFLNCADETDSDQTKPAKEQRAKKQLKFDDWDSDADDESLGHKKNDSFPDEEYDSFPDEEYFSFFDLLNNVFATEKARHEQMIETRSHEDDFLDRALKEFTSISNGWVNFNHFISTNTTITPGLLVQGWNRGAAFMTKSRTHGIDAIIPVVVKPDTEFKDRGPLFGLWTQAQHEAASSILTFITIDGKNWSSMTAAEIQHSLNKCRPLADNFAFHTPVHPFISIVQCVGHEDSKRPGVKIHTTASLEEWKQGKQFQLQVSVVGLSAATYKCLENRPNTVRILKRLRDMTVNPLSGLSKEKERLGLIVDTLPGQIDPARQVNMRIKPRTGAGGGIARADVATARSLKKGENSSGEFAELLKGRDRY